MLVLKEILTEHELFIIEALKDITKNSTVDDIDVFCYVRVHEIITEEKNIDCFTNEELLKILMQMKCSIDFLNDLGFVDTGDIMSTKVAYKKIKDFFMDKIKLRNCKKGETNDHTK